MMFFRFPHTPHIAWLGEGQPRDDKALSSAEAADLLARVVMLKEKAARIFGYCEFLFVSFMLASRCRSTLPVACHDHTLCLPSVADGR